MQLNLATGRDVNSALQDPQNFFTSRALDNRASDLSRLLDGISQSIRAVQETVTGTESIQELLDLADSLLNEAELELFNGADDPDPTIVINDPSELTTYVPSQDFGGVTNITNDGTTIFFDGNLWRRVELDYTITENTVLRFDYQSTNIPEISAIGFDNDQSFTTGRDRFFLNGTQTGAIPYAAPEGQFQYSGSGDLETIEIPVGEFFQGDFSHLVFIHDDDGAGDDGDALFQNITLFESNDIVIPQDRRDRQIQFEADYNEILEQIDRIAADANYRGINLLEGETLRTNFNEDLTSFLDTNGIDATRQGLGIQEADFEFLGRLRASRDQISVAREEIRNFTFSLQNNLSVISTRETFTREQINALQSGSDDLVLADQNREGANLLALQVRQQLQFQVLSLSETSIAQFI